MFITFEGVEGCGKSTQSRLLFRRLTKENVPAILIHEPGITPLGKKITNILKWSKDLEISPLAETMLFNASRAQLVHDVIRPALTDGKVIVCDRFADSTTAYQGYGRGLDLKSVSAVNRVATAGLMPDLTVLLDMPGEKGLVEKDQAADRFHAEKVAFHRRVREGYLKLVSARPARWLVLDATKPKKEIADIIWQKAQQLLKK